MSKLKEEKTEKGGNSHNPASNSAPGGVISQVESAVFDFDFVREDEFVVETGAGFGGWGGNVD